MSVYACIKSQCRLLWCFRHSLVAASQGCSETTWGHSHALAGTKYMLSRHWFPSLWGKWIGGKKAPSSCLHFRSTQELCYLDRKRVLRPTEEGCAHGPGPLTSSIPPPGSTETFQGLSTQHCVRINHSSPRPSAQPQPNDALHSFTGEKVLSHLRWHLTVHTSTSGPSAQDGTPSRTLPLASWTNVLWNSPHVETTHTKQGTTYGKARSATSPNHAPTSKSQGFCHTAALELEEAFEVQLVGRNPVRQAASYINTWGSSWAIFTGLAGRENWGGATCWRQEALDSQIPAGQGRRVCLYSEVKRRCWQLWKLRRRENPLSSPSSGCHPRAPSPAAKPSARRKAAEILTREKRIPKCGTPFPQPRGTCWPEIPGDHHYYLKLTKGGTCTWSGGEKALGCPWKVYLSLPAFPPHAAFLRYSFYCKRKRIQTHSSTITLEEAFSLHLIWKSPSQYLWLDGAPFPWF